MAMSICCVCQNSKNGNVPRHPRAFPLGPARWNRFRPVEVAKRSQDPKSPSTTVAPGAPGAAMGKQVSLLPLASSLLLVLHPLAIPSPKLYSLAVPYYPSLLCCPSPPTPRPLPSATLPFLSCSSPIPHPLSCVDELQLFMSGLSLLLMAAVAATLRWYSHHHHRAVECSPQRGVAWEIVLAYVLGAKGRGQPWPTLYYTDPCCHLATMLIIFLYHRYSRRSRRR